MGKDGYRHYQIRLGTNRIDLFDWCKAFLPTLHIEEAGTRNAEYERKTGCYLYSKESREVRAVRFGTLTQEQKTILESAEAQNDREIDVFYDPTGNHGKSWLTIHQWERGNGFSIPRGSATPEKISGFICSSYDYERYILVDVPRASTVDARMYECLEDIKDGLVHDYRFKGRTRNVRGAKLILFTNAPINPDLLSWDRWRLHRWDNYSESWADCTVSMMREMYQYIQEKKSAKRKKKADKE